jgi:hypothetical protein
MIWGSVWGALRISLSLSLSHSRSRSRKSGNGPLLDEVSLKLRECPVSMAQEIPQNCRAEIPHFILIQSRPNPLGGLISARVSRSRSIIS